MSLTDFYKYTLNHVFMYIAHLYQIYILFCFTVCHNLTHVYQILKVLTCSLHLSIFSKIYLTVCLLSFANNVERAFMNHQTIWCVCIRACD